jgi:PmbA protein
MPVALDPSLGVEVAQDAVARATKAGADCAKAIHHYRERFEVNFDTDDVTLVRSTVTDTISLTVYDETRKGSVEISGRAPDAVDAAVVQAVEAAAAGQPDPANVLPEDPAPPAESRGDIQPDKDAMIDAVLRHVRHVREAHPVLVSRDASNYAFTCSWASYANSHGRVQHARTGDYVLMVMLAAKDGPKVTSFNYAADVRDATSAELWKLPIVDALIGDTLGSFDARPVPQTFKGDVIFTPQALGTLVGSVTGALSGMSLMRKATPFLDKLGSSVAAPGFTLAHRPSALTGASAFDDEGFPNHDLPLITNGVLENFLIGWYTSKKLERSMTSGSADLLVEPGDVALDDLIARTERGILLGRYSGNMPNQNLDFSGVAKNSFYIEDGRVRFPINETMVAGNFASALEQITGISREVIDSGYQSYPWLATTGITVSTK